MLSDWGPMSLQVAAALARFYAGEALAQQAAGAAKWSRACARRARSLEEALIAATVWRRAAGWGCPDEADDPARVRRPAAPRGHRTA